MASENDKVRGAEREPVAYVDTAGRVLLVRVKAL